MEENLVTCNNRIRKLNKEDDVHNHARNISDLPEAILEHILSFLTLKDAVRTSALSKKWRYLWITNPKLVLTNPPSEQRKLFMKFVDRVLFLHERYPIKEFVLEYKLLANTCRVNDWISTVVRQKVQKCTIRLTDIRKKLELHNSLFTCETLMYLELKMRYILRLPSRIHLPILKVLKLYNVKVSDDSAIRQLFASPALEELHLHRCNWMNLSTISISAPKLKTLDIQEYEYDPHNYNCQVIIGECNLDYFNFSGPFLDEYSTYNFSVVTASISVSYDVDGDFKRSRLLAHRLNKFLSAICSVQVLGLSDTTLDLIEDTREMMSCLPILNALETLQLGILDVKSGVLGDILQNTPHLETLHFYEGMYCPFGREEDELFNPVPSCFFSSLKVIKIKFCYGEEKLCLLKTMLKYAVVLEELVLTSKVTVAKDNEAMKVCQVLTDYPHGSNCRKIVLKYENPSVFKYHFKGEYVEYEQP